MSTADNDKLILDKLLVAVKDWKRIFLSDPVNEALGLEEVLTEHLVRLRRIRWYAIGGPVAVEKLWREYVEVEDYTGEMKNAILDFYMNGATYMWLATPVVQMQKESFIGHLCNVLAWVRSSPLVPEYVREYAHDYDSFQKLLKENHWILLMVLLSITPVDQ